MRRTISIEMAGEYRTGAYQEWDESHNTFYKIDLMQELKELEDIKDVILSSPFPGKKPEPSLPDRLLGVSKGRGWHEIKPIERKNNTHKEILLEKQSCQHCLAIGKISTEIKHGDICPQCKEKSLEYIGTIIT